MMSVRALFVMTPLSIASIVAWEKLSGILNVWSHVDVVTLKSLPLGGCIVK